MKLTFTCITEVRNSIRLTQHEAGDPTVALREHIASLPFDDGSGPFDGELEWLQSIAGGRFDVHLLPVGHCKNTWLWLDGARNEPQYLTYLVQTDNRQAPNINDRPDPRVLAEHPTFLARRSGFRPRRFPAIAV